MNAQLKRLQPLDGWHTFEWMGRVLVGRGPDNRRVSLGEISGQEPNILIELLTPTGGLANRDAAGDEESARTLLERMVVDAGGYWATRQEPEDPDTETTAREASGAWCRRLRRERDWTQAELARRLGKLTRRAIQDTQVSNFEMGLLAKKAPILVADLERIFGACYGSSNPVVVSPLVDLLDRVGVPPAPLGSDLEWRVGWLEGRMSR